MNYLSKILIVIAFVVVGAFAYRVDAQTASMPIFYDQSGGQVNSANMQAGTYYRNNNGTGEIYYYGNNRYYDPSTMTFWEGSTNLSQTFSQTGTTGGTGTGGTSGTTGGTTVTPGVPNTGAGGQAILSWFMLAVSLIAIGGVTYAATRQNTI